jgi:threonine/homoserine/homoserine lactone efflux protein
LALIAGVAPLLQEDLFFIVVSFAGALILGWMAFGMFRSLPHLRIEWGTDGVPNTVDETGSGTYCDVQSNEQAGPTFERKNGPVAGISTGAEPVRAMRIGVLLSIANPYWVVWWATIGLGLVARAQNAGLFGIIIFFIGHQAADFAWYSLVSTAVGKGRRFFNDRVYRGIIAVSAVVLIGFSVYFGWSGAERLGIL